MKALFIGTSRTIGTAISKIAVINYVL